MLIKYYSDFKPNSKFIFECFEYLSEELMFEARILDVHKIPIKTDESNRKFLYNFDPRFWKQAAIKRFDLLYEALKEREKIRKKEYDKYYEKELKALTKDLKKNPILRFLSSDVQSAMSKNTVHRQVMERIAKITDEEFWQGIGKKYISKMEFIFDAPGGKQEIYEANPDIKSLIDNLEGIVGESGGIDLSNPHEVSFETVNDATGEVKKKIKRKTNGFEFPEDETIALMQKKLLVGIANGLLTNKKITSHITRENGEMKKHDVTHVASSVVFSKNHKINDVFAFTHEQKRIFKNLRRIFNNYKEYYNNANDESRKISLLKSLIDDLKNELPFLQSFKNCNDYKECERFFHDATIDSNSNIYKNSGSAITSNVPAKGKNLQNPDIGIPDKFFADESIIETLSWFLSAKQLVEWAKQGELKNANDEPIVYDKEKEDLIFPELKIPTFQKEIKYKVSKPAIKGGGFEEKTKTVSVPVLFSGTFAKEHDENNPEHVENHRELQKRGFIYNPRTKQKEHRFVNAEDLEKSGHQGMDHDRFGVYYPPPHMSGVEFLDLKDPEIKNRLESLIRDEGLCRLDMKVDSENNTSINFIPASHTDNNTILCGVAQTIKDNLTSGQRIDRRKMTEEDNYLLAHFPIIYKIVTLHLLSNLNSNKVQFAKQRRAYISQIVTDFKQKNLAGKGTRKKRQLQGGNEMLLGGDPNDTQNEMSNLINKLKFTLLTLCDARQRGVCTPCNPEDYACEIKAAYPIEKVIEKAEEIDAASDHADKNLKPSNLENQVLETDKMKTMLIALAVSKDFENKPKNKKNLKDIDNKIKEVSSEIEQLFISQKSKNINMVDIVKNILRIVGVIR